MGFGPPPWNMKMALPPKKETTIFTKAHSWTVQRSGRRELNKTLFDIGTRIFRALFARLNKSSSTFSLRNVASSRRRNRGAQRQRRASSHVRRAHHRSFIGSKRNSTPDTLSLPELHPLAPVPKRGQNFGKSARHRSLLAEHDSNAKPRKRAGKPLLSHRKANTRNKSRNVELRGVSGTRGVDDKALPLRTRIGPRET